MFYVQPYREFKAKFCCRRCTQKNNGKQSIKYWATVRGTGNKSPYVKFHNRHMHRVIAEQKLGRPLLPGEIVHHDDRNGKHNDPGNLVVTTQSNHIRLHHREMLAARKAKHGY